MDRPAGNTQELAIAWQILAGALPPSAFQDDPDSCIFLLSLRAAGTGLNLTAASYVVLYDPWWNPAVEAQAIDRSHRIGQTQTVNAYRLISPGTVEEKIWDLQQSKAQTIAESGEKANDGNKFIEIAVFKGAAVMPTTDKSMITGIAKFMSSKAMPKKADK